MKLVCTLFRHAPDPFSMRMNDRGWTARCWLCDGHVHWQAGRWEITVEDRAPYNPR